MRLYTSLAAIALLAMSGCATPDSLPAVSVINSLSFDNAVSGKRDGLRSAWPAATLGRTSEQFPMAQIKQCEQGGAACSWGVLKAQRSFGKVSVMPDGVLVEVEVQVDVERSQHTRSGDQDTSMTIPADVGALQARRVQKRSMVLEYGKPVRLEFNYGISYELCALRLDAARQALDKCEIAYF
jgi:hypothetical protein